MGFWSSYRSSLKSLDVEEPIDVWVHRPPAYLVAKACLRLPISPDAVTAASMVVGIAAAAVLVSPLSHHAAVGALLIFLSTVLDCTDGQLARMRGTSSAWGRMVDGVADLFTVGAVAPATLWIMGRGYEGWQKVGLLTLGAITVVTSAFHTAMFDHYKNAFLRFTERGERDGHAPADDPLDSASAPTRMAIIARVVRFVYAFYARAQRHYVTTFDPCGASATRADGANDAARAAIYRSCAGPSMRVWKALFGTGSLMFGLALFHLIGRPQWFLVYRLVVLNAVFYLVLRPMQRRASCEALRRMRSGSALGEMAAAWP